jgi:hypothetical protein
MPSPSLADPAGLVKGATCASPPAVLLMVGEERGLLLELLLEKDVDGLINPKRIPEVITSSAGVSPRQTLGVAGCCFWRDRPTGDLGSQSQPDPMTAFPTAERTARAYTYTVY